MPSYDPTQDNLLLFDGVCHLCDSSVRFIIGHDPAGLIKYTPIQSPLGSTLYRKHGLNPEAPSVFLFITPQGGYKASDAALEIARTLGGWWRLALVLKIIPRSIRDAVYSFIARNRYRWFGKEETCMMPTPALRARVVDGG